MFGQEVALSMPREIQDDLYAAFPGLDKEINAPGHPVTLEQIRSYFPNAIVDIEDSKFSLEFDKLNHNDRNSLRMLYRMWRCHRMMRRYEEEMNVRFSRVVQFRPDIVPPAALPDIEEGTLYIPGGMKPDFVHDMMACGQADDLAVIASAFGRAVGSCLRPWEGIHKELFNLVEEAGLRVLPLEPAQPITEEFDSRARINRRLLKNALEAKRYQFAILGQPAWTEVSGVLLAAVTEADVFDVGSRDLFALLDSVASAPAIEAALSVLSVHHEKRGRLCDAVVFETYRVLVALHSDGLSRLNHFLFQDIVARLRSLREGSGLGNTDRTSVALIAWEQSGAISGGAVLATRRLNAILPDELMGYLDLHLPNVVYPDIGALASDFWRVFSDSEKREQARSAASQIIATNPLDWRGYDHMGHYYSRCEEPIEALKYSLLALERERKHWGLWVRAASLYAEIGQHEHVFACLLSGLRCPHGQVVRDYITGFADKLQSSEVAELSAEVVRLYG